MTRIFTDHRCLRHQVGSGYPERPERLEGILAHFGEGPRAPTEAGEHPASEEVLVELHSERYLRRFQAAVERGDGLFDSADNPLSAGSWEAARAAVDTTLHAADWIAGGTGRRAFAGVRPPGHHAEKEVAMGFCYFNNVAAAVRYLQTQHGLERVAIYDFDVHHGNGTQHLFEADGSVYYASTHQYPFYPGTGAASERGRGAGEGATLNVPLPAGSGDGTLGGVIRQFVIPALRGFEPDALLVSAGFDVWVKDPLGGFRISREALEEWGRWLAELADEVCEGRVLALLEGGYDLENLPGLVEAFSQGLVGGED